MSRLLWWVRQARRLEAKIDRVLALQESMMSDLTGLNAAIASLQTEVGAIGTQMDTLLADLKAAHASGDQAAIDAATVAVQAQVDALKTIATRDAP